MDDATLVVWASLAAGAACLLIAFALALREAPERKAAREAVRQIADATKRAAAADKSSVQPQAADLATSLEALAALAKALKDLDRVAQLLTVALGFFVIVIGLPMVATGAWRIG